MAYEATTVGKYDRSARRAPLESRCERHGCGARFHVPPSRRRRGNGRYCVAGHPRGMSVDEAIAWAMAILERYR